MKHWRTLGRLLSCLILSLTGFPALATASAKTSPSTIALPQLNDGMGWKRPEYYKTIQTVSLGSDGESGLLARWIDGLHVYRFNRGALVPHSAIPDLADRFGFTDPSWYETIRAAVLSPKTRMADILVRKSDGMHVFRFDPGQRAWHEIGGSGPRPFADTAENGTQWNQPQYYKTITVADLNKDGAAELIGRGRNGLMVYSWQEATASWQALASEGELADGGGNDHPSSYETVQTIDVDQDGIPEILARSSGGVTTLHWTGSTFAPLSSNGPFGDADGGSRPGRYRSIHSYRDSTGQAWLYGLGEPVQNEGTIEVYAWKDHAWGQTASIPFRGNPADKEQMSSTVLAADLAGSAAPEFVVRTSKGLMSYSLQGKPVGRLLTSFSNAEGWGREHQFSTLTTATIQAGGSTAPVILGRGWDGLHAVKFAGSWQPAADSTFPPYCATVGSDTCNAYKCLSGIGAGVYNGVPVTDIRSLYTANDLLRGFWETAAGNILEATTPRGDGNCPSVQPTAWTTVENQLQYETSQVAVVAGWFSNNSALLQTINGASGNLLSAVVGNLNNIDGSTQVATEWGDLGLDLVTGLLNLLPGGGEADLVISILKDVINMSTPNDASQAINGLTNDLNNQYQAALIQNANQRQLYVTDYGKLQQLGPDVVKWSNFSSTQMAQAEVQGMKGLSTHFYKIISPYKWQVAWCSQSYPPSRPPYTSVPCYPVDTPDKYYCQYGTPDPYAPYAQYHSNAYLTTGPFGPALSWSSVDQITGTGQDDLNAIWYMMMLGSDLGWNYTAFINDGGYNQQTESELTYEILQNGYNGPSSSCLGNGSNTGVKTSGQSLSQLLTVAAANTLSLLPEDVRRLDRRIDRLEYTVRGASIDEQSRTLFLEWIEQSKELLHRVYTHPAGSIAAATPTTLMESIVQRVASMQIADAEKAEINSRAFAVLEELEYPASGQTASQADTAEP